MPQLVRPSRAAAGASSPLAGRALRLTVAGCAVALAIGPAAAGAQNLALNKPTASTTPWCQNCGPERAVDGNRNGNFNVSPFIFHTFAGTVQRPAWWYVDLGATALIGRIEFFNRTDFDPSRIVGATLGIFATVPYGQTPATPVWSSTFTSGALSQVITPPTPQSGRYVGIMHTSNWLHFGEVEVYAGTNTTVPEPGTYALVATGLVGVSAAMRRRRRA